MQIQHLILLRLQRTKYQEHLSQGALGVLYERRYPTLCGVSDRRGLAHSQGNFQTVVPCRPADAYIRGMTQTSWHIPDPNTQPEFYDDVPVKRLVACGVDIILTAFLCVIILPFTAFTGIFFLPLLFLTVGFFYRLATVTQFSATLGMRLMSIELITMRGERLDATRAFSHCLGFTISCVIPPLLLASGVMMLTTARGQGLTDAMLGTLAVNRRAAM